jgi:hypothetical protein
MRRPFLVRDNIVSAERVAENFGMPLSRVRTIEKLLKKSRKTKAIRTKKHAPNGVAGTKQSNTKTK